MNTSKLKPHILSLSLLFVAGDAIITLPFLSSDTPLLSLLLCCVFSIIFVLLWRIVFILLARFKTSLWVNSVFICLLSLLSGAIVFYEYLLFLINSQFPKSSPFILGVAMIFVLFFFVKSSPLSLYKFSLVSAVFCGIVLVICFLSGIKNFSFNDFSLNCNGISQNFSKIFFCRFFSLGSLVVYTHITTDNSTAKPLLCGVLLGFLALVFSLLQSMLTLNNYNVAFPYLYSVSTISLGSLFTRLDGMVYFLFFITAFLKITINIKTLVLLIAYCKFSQKVIK